MTSAQHEQSVRGSLAKASGTDPGDWYLVSKARHALLVVLGRGVEPTAGMGQGEVITQPLTCLTAVAPVLGAGLAPVYADVDQGTLTIDPATVTALVTRDTRAVIAQHTFGAVAPLTELRQVTPEDALLIEDSAHCLGELGRDADGEPVADVSVHSFGVEKILPTRAGAAVWLNPRLAERDSAAHVRLRAALTTLPTGGLRYAVAHRAGTPLRRVAGRLGRPGAVVLDRVASAGLADQAIMPSEKAGVIAGEPTHLSGRPLREVAEAIRSWPDVVAHRRRIAQIYRDGLAEVPGLVTPATLADPQVTLVRYPLLVDMPERAAALFDRLQAAGLVPGRWYRPTLFPGPADLEPFGYDPQRCPSAEDASSRILNLQTAPFVTQEAARHTVTLLRSAA